MHLACAFVKHASCMCIGLAARWLEDCTADQGRHVTILDAHSSCLASLALVSYSDVSAPATCTFLPGPTTTRAASGGALRPGPCRVRLCQLFANVIDQCHLVFEGFAVNSSNLPLKGFVWSSDRGLQATFASARVAGFLAVKISSAFITSVLHRKLPGPKDSAKCCAHLLMW